MSNIFSKSIFIAATFVSFFSLTADENNQDANMQSSAMASQDWLNTLDSGDFGKSWEQASLTLQFTMPKKEWVRLMTAVRKPLGDVVSRSILQQLPAKDPKGLPAGDYMVLYYDTSFKNRKTAKELITMVQNSEGQWKVLTYNVN